MFVISKELVDSLRNRDLLPIQQMELSKLVPMVILDQISLDDVMNKALYIMRKNHKVILDGWLKFSFKDNLEADHALFSAYWFIADKSDSEKAIEQVVYCLSDSGYFRYGGKIVNIRTGELHND